MSSFGVNDPTQEPEERQGLLETFKKEGVGAGVSQLGQMLVPQSAFEEHVTARGLARDMVEFSPVGDIKDMWAGFSGRQGEWELDPLERAVAVLFSAGPLVFTAGVAAKVHQNARLSKRMQAQVAAADLADMRSIRTEVRERMQPAPAEQPSLEEMADPAQQGRVSAWAAQRAAERTSPVYAAFQTHNYNDLAAFVADHMLKVGGNKSGHLEVSRGDVVATEENLRIIGARTVALSAEGQFAAPDREGIVPTREEQEFTAAQMAVSLFMRAVEDGQLQGLTKSRARQVITSMTLSSVDNHLQMLDGISDLAVKAWGQQIGPDLITNPQSRVEKISWNPAEGPPRIFVGYLTELLPTARLIDRNTGLVINKKALGTKLKFTDYQTLVGDMSGNIIRMLAEEKLAHPERYEKSTNWYRSANATAEYLARVTGRPTTRIAGVLSALSPRSKWTPDNLVAGTHLALRYGTQLDPQSAEYRQHFVDAVNAGGWAQDLWTESNQSVQKQFTVDGKPDLAGIVEYYSNWDVVHKPQHGEMGVAGAEMDMKKVGAELFMNSDIPLQMILRAAKTHEFAYLIDNPNADAPVAVDAHTDKDTLGFVWAPDPLGSKGYRKLKKGEKFSEEATGLEWDPEELTQARAELERLGWETERIDRQLETFKKVLNDETMRRYNSQRMALAVAADALGLDFNHMAQAASWVPGRETRKRVRKLLKKKDLTRAELEEIAAGAVFDWSVPSHLEGSPQQNSGVIGATANPTTNLDMLSLEAGKLLVGLKTTSKGARSGTGIVVEDLGDRSVAVYAADVPGVREALRHTFPTGFRFGEYSLQVPRRPHIVRSVAQHLKALNEQYDPKGKRVVGETRQWVATADGVYPQQHAGNWMVFEVEPSQLDPFLSTLKGLEGAFDPTVQPGVVVSRNDIGRQNINPADVDSKTMPKLLMENDWVAISSMTDRFDPELHQQLGEDLRAAGYHPMEANGSYMGETEPSWFAFGVNYATAERLRAKYNQESYATRRGLVFADKAWAPEPEKLVVGPKALEQDGFTQVVLPNGDEFTFSLPYNPDLGTALEGAGEFQGTAVPQAGKKVVRVSVPLGADVALPWDVTDRLWRTAREHRGVVNSEAHLHGALWMPEDLVRVYDSVYTDASGRTGTYRTRHDPGSRNTYDVWVPADSAAALSSDGNRLGKGLRDLDDIKGFMRSENGTLYIDEDVEIVFDPEADVKIGKHPLDVKIDGERIAVATIDHRGEIPKILPGVDEFGPGLSRLTFRGHEIIKIEAFSNTDSQAAAETLRAAGVPINVLDMEIDTQVYEVDFDPSAGSRMPFFRIGKDRHMKADSTLGGMYAKLEQERIAEAHPKADPIEFRFGLSTVRSAETISRTYEGLRYPDTEQNQVAARLKEFTKEGIWGIDRIQVVDVYDQGMRKHGLLGAVEVSHTGVLGEIVITEEAVVKNQEGGYNMSADMVLKSRGFKADPAGIDVIESTLVHESMHIVERNFREAGLGSAFRERVLRGFDEMGGFAEARLKVSDYGSSLWQEFVAELFVTQMYRPEAVHPAGTALLKDIFKAHDYLKNRPSDPNGALKKLGAKSQMERLLATFPPRTPLRYQFETGRNQALGEEL